MKRFSDEAAQKKKAFAESSGGSKAAIASLKDDWLAFGKLAATLVSRSIISTGMLTFIPLFFMSILFLPEADSSLRLSVYAIFCAAAP
jgi:hypothetical protein